jgi:hypothetical protein
MDKKTYIYALTDPRTNEVRYIGKADEPSTRLKHHLKPKQLQVKTAKNSWLKNLLADNIQPKLKIVEEVFIENWENRERYWIAYYTSLGYRLTNGTKGGDGGAPNEEARKKISRTLKGRKLSVEQRQKMSDSHKGRIFSENTKKKISEAKKGHIVSKSTREKIGKANKGFKHSDEAKKLISRAGRGRRPKNTYSKYLGVSFDKRRNHWIAYLTIDRTNKFIGSFSTEIDAAKARDKYALMHWGREAILNFPDFDRKRKK